MTNLTAFPRARTLALRQRVVPWFLGTRLVMLLLTLNVVPYFNPGAIWGDVALYDKWINGSFRHGAFPLGDLKWQYPPGAAGPILFPKLVSNALIPGSYYVAFYAMCFAADALIFRMLLKTARASSPEAPSLAGPWAWTLGLPAIGPMVYGRYDLVVTAFAVAALTVTLKSGKLKSATLKSGKLKSVTLESDRATSTARGVLIGLGTLVKVWPAAILFGVPRGRQGRTVLTTAVLAVAVPSAALAVAFPGVLSFLTHQEDRGIQVESVFATPFLVGHWFGWSGHVENSAYGAYEYIGPGVSAVAGTAIFATALGFAALLLWRWKARRRAELSGGFSVTMLADVTLAATMIAMVTSRVLSPQYLIWALGLSAVCLARRDSVQRVPSLVIVAAMAVTQLIFPLFYHSLRGGQIYSGLLLLGRNAALVTATVMAVIALFRWARQDLDESGPDIPRQLSSEPRLTLEPRLTPEQRLTPEPQPERTSATSQ